MKILFHHRTQGKGVEGIHIMGVVNALRELGHIVNIICLPETNPEKGLDRQNITKKSASPYSIFSKMMPNVFFDLSCIIYNFYSYLKMKNSIKVFNPDIIFERYSFFSFAVAYVARKKDIPFFLEVNNTIEQDIVRSIKLKKLGRWIEKYVLQKARHIFTVSQFLKNHIKSNIEEKKITVLSNAVDEKLFNPEKVDSTHIINEYNLKDKIVIGFVGLFVPWHGLDFLLDIFNEILKSNKRVHLLLVGDGPERSKIEHFIALHNLHDNISITGFVKHDEIPTFIFSMDIAVMPNSNPHGSPMKIFEYMSMGKPVIAPSYGPIMEIIESNINGMLFAPKDNQELFNALELLSKNSVLRSNIGKKARMKILEQHTWLQNGKKIEEMFYKEEI